MNDAIKAVNFITARHLQTLAMKWARNVRTSFFTQKLHGRQRERFFALSFALRHEVHLPDHIIRKTLAAELLQLMAASTFVLPQGFFKLTILTCFYKEEIITCKQQTVRYLLLKTSLQYIGTKI
jgi:hypothetical protein